ncbi:ABC transporter ATP-binding protein [Streptomonospora litoralis]|uniref:Bacitracin export ATP-binding protein BceA n=1 Tax=Streptomonospora litoralis TaxID=2498135 RepID=A0A4P6PXS8_9ACTN|nr:ABC transporter ATP-binding protein [Streptomonospora litoralis]QBI53076.1 Bacitracin export ATP-binding protein BceA [Streptomonospora litoralis]
MSTTEPGSAPVLEAVDLVKRYGAGEAAVTAVDRISVGFSRGGFTAVMGPSGSGKSTLMHLLAGLDAPTEGRVVLDGADLTHMDDRSRTRIRRNRIGFIFQAFNLLPTFTAEQNILLPLKLSKRRPDQALFDRIVADLGIADRLSHRPGELSGGQQQRVAIARALLTEPAVIFADEPTGALDIAAGRELLTRLRSACVEMGQTIVMVTHDPVAATYADQVLMLADGAVHGRIEQPTTDGILASMKQLEEV